MTVHTTTYFSFGPDPTESRRLQRVIWWSVGVHVGAVALAFVLPRSWFGPSRDERSVMTISLGGTAGPRSSGTTSIGGRTIERVAPPEKRPEPIRPTPPAPPAPAAAKPTPKPTPTTAKPAATPPARAAVTGPQIAAGNTAVETGARSQGAGLTFGGGGTGGETDLSDFCCADYLQQIGAIIEARWARGHNGRGTTILRFTIRRDGSIDLGGLTVQQSSGNSIQDRAARAALFDARLLPLPAEYTNPTLTIHLSFPYGSQ